MLGYVRFVLKLGTKSLPVEALVLPHLGPDAMLIDNSIIKAFGVKLDWAAERLSFSVCVLCVFFPFILDFNGRTSRGHTGRR